MTIPLVVPTCWAAGVPDTRPVAVSNDAQAGRFEMPNVSVSPSGTLAVGATGSAAPTVTAVVGVPEIVGDRFGGALTTIWNVAGCALAPSPSLMPMPMFENVPT